MSLDCHLFAISYTTLFSLLLLHLNFKYAVNADQFARGADVSWVSEEEATGKAFYNSAGTKTDPFVLLKKLGINAIRLRVWVNPSDGGWCDGKDTLSKAKRAVAQGQRLMIDFHYR